MEVKICGITRREDARAATEAGADYLGFVFADSPRRVDPGSVGELTAGLSVARVGVFVDRSPASVRETARTAGLGAVQLHGHEPPEACRRLSSDGLTVWKALRPRSVEELVEGVGRYRDRADAILVEGHSPEAAGGVGAGFPHEWIEALEGSGSRFPLVLAGGLTAETVAEAVRRVRPEVVDVSSGVERRPGVKDPARIHAFVAAARAAGREASGAGAREREG